MCRKRLMKMVASIGERLAAKLGNANDNAFKMRRLFKMYDADASGCIHLDDLRMMMESFGIQLDDDSLLALYHVYDKECTGYLKYEDLMKVLLDQDYFALYTGSNDVTQASSDLETVKKMVATIKGKFRTSVEELAKVLRCLDEKQTGGPASTFRL
jgi:Ca2+-binding EF-hand superfamily protein